MIRAFLDIREIHKVFDAAEDVLKQDIGIPICLPNCGLCCMQNVPKWMTIEAINAVSVLTGMGKLRGIVSIAEGWLLEKDKNATLYEGMPRGWASPKLRDEWQAVSRSQCPFMGPDKGCLIYEVRPFACRAFGVTRDNSDICPRPLGRGESLSQRCYIPADRLRDRIEDFREECEGKNKAWIISAFAPTAFYRAAEEERFRQLVLDNKIPSAKLVAIEFEVSLMWQPQVDSLRGGVSPDLVAAMPRNGNSVIVGRQSQ